MIAMQAGAMETQVRTPSCHWKSMSWDRSPPAVQIRLLKPHRPIFFKPLTLWMPNLSEIAQTNMDSPLMYSMAMAR